MEWIMDLLDYWPLVLVLVLPFAAVKLLKSLAGIEIIIKKDFDGGGE